MKINLSRYLETGNDEPKLQVPRIKIDLSSYAPPGVNLQREQRFFNTGIICSFLFSLLFFLRYDSFRRSLYHLQGGRRMLKPGSIMADFSDVLGNALIGFLILALCTLALIVYHYIYHWQGSKSIYLMKRLPDQWELHRRCLTLPLLAALLCLLAAAALLLIYYGFYMTFTPEECLTPGQWQKIWSVLL